MFVSIFEGDNPQRKSLLDLLKMEDVDLRLLENLIDTKYKFVLNDPILMQRLKIHALYKDVEIRQIAEINDIKINESIPMPLDFDYNKLNLSLQAKEILTKFRPTSLGAATRIPGITASTIHSLFVYFKYANTVLANKI